MASRYTRGLFSYADIAFEVARDAIQENGLPGATESYDQQTLGRKACPNPIESDSRLFEQLVPARQFRRRSACAGCVGVRPGVHV